jgi:hypothetical protein
MASFSHAKQAEKISKSSSVYKETTLNTAKYTYELPPTCIWNQIELKVILRKICDEFSISGDMEIDNGNGFSYTVITNFPSSFQT